VLSTRRMLGEGCESQYVGPPTMTSTRHNVCKPRSFMNMFRRLARFEEIFETFGRRVARRIQRRVQCRVAGESAELVLLRLGATCAIAARGRNIHRLTQRQPHFAGIGASGQCLISRATRKRTDDEIVSQDAPIRLTELIGNGTPEFTEFHDDRLRARAPLRRTRKIRCQRIHDAASENDAPGSHLLKCIVRREAVDDGNDV